MTWPGTPGSFMSWPETGAAATCGDSCCLSSAAVPRGALDSAAGRQLSPADQQRLAALGYLSGTVKVDDSLPLADPKDKIAVSNSLTEATRLLEQKRPEEAAALLERLTREEPELADAWSLLGNVNLKRQRQQEALACFRRALALKPDNNFLMLNIVKTLVGLGKIEDAAAENLRFLKSFRRRSRPAGAIGLYPLAPEPPR